MKVEIWRKQDCSRAVKGKCVWKGEMSVIPHVDEFVVIYDGWASERILEVHYNLYDNSVDIAINPDYVSTWPA
jgi:hypothetical protein